MEENFMQRQHLNQIKNAIAPPQPENTIARSSTHPIAELQGAIGNRAVNQLLANQPIVQAKPMFRGLSHELVIQPKLSIGAVGDKYEQEADRVARQVVDRVDAPQTIGRTQASEKENAELRTKPTVQRLSDGEETATPPDLEASIQQIKGRGQPLIAAIRQPMEQALGADFRDVKIHTDSKADRLNQSIQAKAFTTGRDILFRQGEYNPSSRGGQELLAHELTHVIQQTGNLQLSSPTEQTSSTETDRSNLANSQNRNQIASVSHASTNLIQRVGGGKTQGILPSLPLHPAITKAKDDQDNPIWVNLGEILFGTETKRRSRGNDTTDQLAQSGKYFNVEDVEIPSTTGNTLRGRYYTANPAQPGLPLVGQNRTILILSGSGGSAEEYTEPIAEQYAAMGASVLSANYRGFGQSSGFLRSPGHGGTPSESGLYDDAYAMFKYLRDVRRKLPGNIVVHGYSLSGPVAASLVKTLAKKDIQVKGLVLHSAMPSAPETAADESDEDMTGMSARVTRSVLGKFDTRQKLRKIQQIYPNLPIHLMSGGSFGGDKLDINKPLAGQATSLGADVAAMGFTALTTSRANLADHTDVGAHMIAALADLTNLLM
jgi:pimeloyl-ACP methyl ester carboxylesterase